MKARVWALMVILLLASVRLLAQDATPEVEYRLRVPTAEEYLGAIPEVIRHATYEETRYGDLQRAVFDEFSYRYPHLEGTTFEQLIEAYRALGFGGDFPWFEEREKWNEWLILSWLATNGVNLDDVDRLAFDNYEIEVTQRDFNADNQHEWLLDVQSGSFTKLLVVQQNDEWQYTLVDTPLPFFGNGFAYYSAISGFMEEQLFDDLNADGLPEWVLAVGGYGANNLNGGYLYVLQWQDGQLVDLAPSYHPLNSMHYEAPAGAARPLFPYGVRVSYEDIDGNGAREIIIDQLQDDNWGCLWNLRRVFAWDGSNYTLSSSERTYDEVQGCEIRAAEEAMWAHDYETAIEHYERGLSLLPSERGFNGDSEETTRYAVARLALAYTLVGRNIEASIVVATLIEREDDSTTLTQLISAVEGNLGDAMAMCRASFEVFNFDCPQQDSCLGSPMNSIVGYTLENSGDDPFHPRNAFPDPAAAGCDLLIPIRDAFLATPPNINVDPAPRLEAMGFTITEATRFDLNDDGIDEWLIRLGISASSVFFYAEPGDKGYRVSFLYIPYGGKFTRRLPNEAGNILISPSTQGFSCPPQLVDGGLSFQSTRVGFAFWRLDRDELVFQQNISFCEDVSFNEVFGTEDQTLPTEVMAWTPLSESPSNSAPATYRWNEERGIYEVVDIQPLPELKLDYGVTSFSATNDARQAMQNNEIQRALEILDRGLLNPNLLLTERNLLLYRRALALEALNRPDEALAEYIAIYEAAPESAWGRLAALHLERVE